MIVFYLHFLFEGNKVGSRKCIKIGCCDETFQQDTFKNKKDSSEFQLELS